MDPVSGLFSIYLNSVMGFSEAIADQYADDKNLYQTAVALEYKAETIKFQHQIWKINEQSVCSDKAKEIASYSKCTVKAQELFVGMCDNLNKKNSNNRKYNLYRNMYCNAAISFKPTIAEIGKVSATETKIDSLRSKCNQATVAAMSSYDPKLIRARNSICEKYKNSQGAR